MQYIIFSSISSSKTVLKLANGNVEYHKFSGEDTRGGEGPAPQNLLARTASGDVTIILDSGATTGSSGGQPPPGASPEGAPRDQC